MRQAVQLPSLSVLSLTLGKFQTEQQTGCYVKGEKG